MPGLEGCLCSGIGLLEHLPPRLPVQRLLNILEHSSLLDALGSFSGLRTTELLLEVVPAQPHVEGEVILPIASRTSPKIILLCAPPVVTQVQISAATGPRATRQGCFAFCSRSLWTFHDLAKSR